MTFPSERPLPPTTSRRAPEWASPPRCAGSVETHRRGGVRWGLRRWLGVVLCWVAAGPATSQEAPAEWPCFHGPYRDNHSPDTGLLKRWPEGGPSRLWTATGLGRGYSSVAIHNGGIYTAGMVGKQTFVIALAAEGSERWRRANGASWEAGQSMPYAAGYSGARATPTCDQGRVYHLSETGSLSCLDAATGEVVWAVDLLTTFDAKVPKYGYTESVLVDGDRLICAPAGTKAMVACLDKATGKTLWANTELPGVAAYASCQMVELAGVRQVLGMTSKVAYGLEPATGRCLWTMNHGNPRDNNATDPVTWNGHVVASSGYGTGSRLIRLTPTPAGFSAETVWASTMPDNHHGGLMVLNGFLYGAGHEAKGWHCLDLQTGQPRWSAPGKGSLTWADGLLYCLEERGTMALIEPTPEGRRELSAFRLPGGGEGLYWAHPVVCGGRLYVRHADRLFAYDVRGK